MGGDGGGSGELGVGHGGEVGHGQSPGALEGPEGHVGGDGGGSGDPEDPAVAISAIKEKYVVRSKIRGSKDIRITWLQGSTWHEGLYVAPTTWK